MSVPFRFDTALRSAAATTLLGLATTANALSPHCGQLAFSVGPWDYRTATPAQRGVIERNHFTPDVEMLRKGASGWLGGDLAYTLSAIPNHHRALIAMANLARKENKRTPHGSNLPIDCWFERAIEFAPNDAEVRHIVGVELLRGKDVKAAIEQLEFAKSLDPTHGMVHYNLGLAYLEARDFSLAADNARRAYDLGVEFPGLRERLKRAGKWVE